MSEYILSEFPNKNQLLEEYNSSAEDCIHEVNGHLHTPYSFSAFRDMEQIFDMAARENLKVLGINDFYVADGYEAFYKQCLNSKIFPLFNIEFIGLLKDEQERDIRVNDPGNPGRCYLSGKGMRYPFEPEEPVRCILKNLKFESQVQVKEMIEKLNTILAGIDTGLVLKYSEVKRMYAKELVRERHIARALRELVFTRYGSEEERNRCYEKLFDGNKPKAGQDNHAALEIEIRARLLKAGGQAFVPEDENAFLPVPEIIEIIHKSGGIPCYPVLLDNAEGECTEYESDMQLLLNELLALKIFCIELIPGRNDINFLRDFVMFFRKNGFIITFGTEHNTPELNPLTITARNNHTLDEELKRISFEGSCVIAAHQYLHAQGLQGYLDDTGLAIQNRMEEFISLGKSVIERFTR